MPTTKSIANIGSTTIDVVKNGTGSADEVNFSVYNGTSPNTVMQIGGDGSSSNTSITTGSVSINNLTVNGTITTSGSTSAPTVTIGEQLLFTDKATTDSVPKASIYALTDPNNGTNHQLIIDPYKEDDPSAASTNSGTVYIRGALVVEGDKTILDTATTVTSENAIRVNTTGDGSTAGGATYGGLEFLYDNGGTTETKSLYYDHSGPHWTTGNTDFKSTGQIYGATLTDGTATLTGGTLTGDVNGDVTSSGTSSFSNVDINGGNIDGTKIGVTTADSGRFTTILASASISTNGAITASGSITANGGLSVASGQSFTADTVSITGGSIDGTVIGATTAVSGSFTTITASGTVTGSSLTDGTANLSSGALTGATTINASGAITGGSLTDGTANLSSGALTGATTINASGTVTGGSLTDGTATLSSGALAGATTINASGAITGGSLTDGTATLSSGSLTGAAAITASGVISTTNTANADFNGSTGSIVTDGGLYIKSSKSIDSGVSTEAALICNGGAYFGENILTGKDIEASGIKSGKFYISRRDGMSNEGPDYNKIIHNYNSVDYTIYRVDPTNGPTIGASNIDIEGDSLTLNGSITVTPGGTFGSITASPGGAILTGTSTIAGGTFGALTSTTSSGATINGTLYVHNGNLSVTNGSLSVTGGNLEVGPNHTFSAPTGGTFGAITTSGGGATSISNTLTVSGGASINSTTDSTSLTTGALIVSGGVSIKKHLYLGQGTTGVLGDVVPVSTSGGQRTANPRVTAGTAAPTAPLGADIQHYFSSKSLDFGTGQFVVSLVEDVPTGGETATAIGTFLYAQGAVKLVHGLEANSTNLDIDVENSSNTVSLTNNSVNDAFYHVRILTIADTSSAQGGY